MIVVDRFTAGSRGGPRTHHIAVCTQSRKDRWIWQAYHWYDMRIPCKVPGWKHFEKLLRRFGGEVRLGGVWVRPDGTFEDAPKKRLRDRPITWGYEQDIRCYHLGERGKKFVVKFEVTEEQYGQLGE